MPRSPRTDVADTVYHVINRANALNEPQSDEELAALRLAVNRGRPFGSDKWLERCVEQFNLRSTLRNRGGQRK
ncbi:MAG: hypothetical protein HYS59_01285 [Candidatus Vogelbacteria bacterium]|nr:hypothetical protein [Candidatus Vogelbacteria bacterium]